MNDRVWTISNGLSALRLVIAFPIAILLLRENASERVWLFSLVAFAVLTDFFDGVAARRLRQVTELGKILDPLADKVVIVTTSCILMVKGVIPLWVFSALLIRESCILAGGLYLRQSNGIVIQSNILGKWTVTISAAFIAYSAARLDVPWVFSALLIASSSLLALSFLSYLRRFLMLVRPPATSSSPVHE